MNVLDTMKQALDFAERTCGGKCNAEYNPCEAQDIATNLRTAIAEMEKVEPVAWIFTPNNECLLEQDVEISAFNETPNNYIPLYPNPAPAVPEGEK